MLQFVTEIQPCSKQGFFILFGCQEQGIAILNKAITACSEEIERHKGKLTVKEAARAVSTNFIFLQH